MSIWGTTIITNFIGAIPIIEGSLRSLLWSSTTVRDHLLKKFFAFHIIAPFVLLMVIALHLALIHSCGNTPRIPSQHYKSESKSGKLFPDFIEEDRRTCMLVTMVMVHFVCFKSFYFDNSSNNLMADRMSTPKHIVPE